MWRSNALYILVLNRTKHSISPQETARYQIDGDHTRVSGVGGKGGGVGRVRLGMGIC